MPSLVYYLKFDWLSFCIYVKISSGFYKQIDEKAVIQMTKLENEHVIRFCKI